MSSPLLMMLRKKASGSSVLTVPSGNSSQYFYDTLGFAAPSSFDFVDNNPDTILEVTRLRPVGAQVNKRVAQLRSLDTTTFALSAIGSPLELSQSSEGVFPHVVWMGNDRAVVMICATDAVAVYILGKSGNVLSEIAYDNFSSVTADGNTSAKTSIQKLSATECVIFFEEAADAECVIVDISGDTISYGSKTTTNLTMADYTGNAIFKTGTRALMSGATKVSLIDLTDMSEISQTTVDIYKNDAMMIAIDEDRILFVFEDNGTPDVIKACVISVDGSDVVTVGTVATIISGTKLFSGPQNQGLVKTGDNEVVFMGYLQDEAPVGVYSSILTIDGSNSVTASATKNVQNGDHLWNKIIPNTDSIGVLCVTQDATTSPTDQVNYKVFNRSDFVV